MTQIAFILLCHKDPDAVIAQARRLIATGDCVAIHYDRNADAGGFARITDALKDEPRVAIVTQRLRCGWGQWSLVAATLRAVELALTAFPEATHAYILSGDCMPIKSAKFARDVLAAGDRDFIESYDFFASDWIKTGLKEERLVYRHLLNERKHKTAFYALMEMQKRLGLQRALPDGLDIRIGSQWWCLRRRTLELILSFCQDRPDVPRFFRTTWIPDETFFQTLVYHLIPRAEIDTGSPTFKLFSDYGMPVTFYNDHFDFLLSQKQLFARKISSQAHDLKANLGDLWASDDRDFACAGDGENVHGFLTQRGRIGRRFAPRFWESAATLGRDRELIMVVCKKWHVAKRFMAGSVEQLGLEGLEYVFDEDACPLPHLGGIERSLPKRNRHRRALMRMLFDYFDKDRLMICLDPGNLELLQDFTSDRIETQIIELRCEVDDGYLMGHAERVGLAGPNTPTDVAERLLPTLRFDFSFESAQIAEANFKNHVRIDEAAPRQDQVALLAGALKIEPAQAEALLPADLFAD